MWADPVGNLWIADGARGIRLVTHGGLIHTAPDTHGRNVVSVTGDVLGTLYAATQGPDHLLQITPDGTVSVVVGTGTSGFNGNTDAFGRLLPGLQVQINRPEGLPPPWTARCSSPIRGTTCCAATCQDRATSSRWGASLRVGPARRLQRRRPGATDQFSAPADIAITGTGELVVTDTDNGRVRLFGR